MGAGDRSAGCIGDPADENRSGRVLGERDRGNEGNEDEREDRRSEPASHDPSLVLLENSAGMIGRQPGALQH